MFDPIFEPRMTRHRLNFAFNFTRKLKNTSVNFNRYVSKFRSFSLKKKGSKSALRNFAPFSVHLRMALNKSLSYYTKIYINTGNKE